MSNQFNIDRQLALRIVTGDFNAQQSAVAELRALLAAPVVERQPVAYVLTRDDEVCYEADDGIVISNTPGDETNLYKWAQIYKTMIEDAPACLDKVKELNNVKS